MYTINEDILEILNHYKTSTRYKNIITAEHYYNGKHDILKRKRTVIGENGIPKEVLNIPNNKIVDNMFSKLIDQKSNYLLSQPVTFKTENELYQKFLNSTLNKKFHKTLKNVCEDSLKFGEGYIFVNYDENGKLKLTRLSPLELIPIYKDNERDELKMAIRFIKQRDDRNKIYELIEVYSNDYIEYYTLSNSKLKFIERKYYFTNKKQNFSFNKFPIIAFKYNNKAIPIISRIKSLQDGINKILSDFQNNMEEDCRNTVLVLQNFDGTNLSEFRRNLSEYGVVKVKTIDGQAGDVKTLSVNIDSTNYKTILDLMKKAIIENGRGFDLKSENTFSNMNKMNIKSLYTDIDLDARGMEMFFISALEDILWFINIDNYAKNNIDFTDENVEIIFNRDTIVNESDVIEDCVNSVGILELDEIRKNHPWL